MKRGRVSELWKYFKIESEQNKTAICLLCKLKLSFRSTASNLKKHLRTKHRGILPPIPRENASSTKGCYSKIKHGRIYKTFDSEPNSPKLEICEEDEQVRQSSLRGSSDTNFSKPLERRHHEEYEALTTSSVIETEPTMRRVFQPRFALSWDSYQNRLCSNLNTLLKNEDFVDLTLAADGHLVKVHQLIMSIASPYLKEIIHSSPARHPIIFLTNVSYATLRHLLQYVYTGQVDITEEELEPFFAAAKALQIQGIDTEIDTNILKSQASDPNGDAARLPSDPIGEADEEDDFGSSQNLIMPRPATTKTSFAPETDKILSKRQPTHCSLQTLAEEVTQSEDLGDVMMDEDMVIVPAEDVSGGVDPIAFYEVSRSEDPDPVNSPPHKTGADTVIVQTMILNRYKYTLARNLEGGVKKWRCMDHLKRGCQAKTITNGSTVIEKSQSHNHPFHE